ncbi:tetratricopeptide repeat protein [Dyella choica]|uniref:Tetratricopeptide repeat protein n=1 Tax=Dyella choica TaxID=1927959 RepID=A0A3S0PN97_9GAMM|nr:tetratricopeptide repeat protein [Dyella choica]RUL76855.1 tetratricopeptide repeat protein [Dyella choica]
MPYRSFRLRHPLAPAALAGLLLTACAQPAPEAPKPPPGKSNALMVDEIRAAGERDKSVINVHPLVDPGIVALQDAARQDERSGQYQAAATKLDMALKRSPEAPDVLQDRAEVAIYMGDFQLAEKLAHQSWALGSKQGPLCARNWQTIVEIRLQVHDQTGAASASKWVGECRETGVQRL